MNRLQKLMKKLKNGQSGQAGIVIMVGLGLFIIGILCLLVWGLNMQDNGGWLFPGVLFAVGGGILLALGLRSGE